MLELDIIQQNLSIDMILETLDGIPDHNLPHDFYFKWYEPGDEKLWLDIHALSEKFIATINLKLYHEQFNRSAEIIRQRQVFIMNAHHEAIGTSTAWFKDDYYGQPFGQVHWVAIIPEFQGKGLAKPLMSMTLKRMVELGHSRAFLSTSTGRVAAIYLYLKLGFKPFIHQDTDSLIWEQLEKALKISVFH